MTGNDAAAKRDILTAIQTRFPPARVLVAETYVQGPYAAGAIVDAMNELCKAEELDAIVVARGGGSFDDLLPFSDERLVRAVPRARASSPRSAMSRTCRSAISPRMSAPRRRASRPVSSSRTRTSSWNGSTAPGPASPAGRAGRWSATANDWSEPASGSAARRSSRSSVGARLEHAAARLRALAPHDAERGYAIVRAGEAIVRSAEQVEPGRRVDVEVAEGAFGARVEDVR